MYNTILQEGEIEGFAMHVLEEEIGEVFVTVHQYFDTSSGDITPEQTLKLDKLIEQLACLIREQVMQNNPKYSGYSVVNTNELKK